MTKSSHVRESQVSPYGSGRFGDVQGVGSDPFELILDLHDEDFGLDIASMFHPENGRSVQILAKGVDRVLEFAGRLKVGEREFLEERFRVEVDETPGLGGEVDNSGWRGLWPGRKVYDGDTVSLGVRKGPAGTPEKDPYNVDGLSGATLTGNGVTKAISFWLGPQGFGPFMQSVR